VILLCAGEQGRAVKPGGGHSSRRANRVGVSGQKRASASRGCWREEIGFASSTPNRQRTSRCTRRYKARTGNAGLEFEAPKLLPTAR